MRPPLFAAGQTVGAARRTIAGALAAAGIDDAEADARLLLQHALGRDRAALLRDADHPLSAAEVERLEELALRRLRREPIAQILGRKEFWSMELGVTVATLIPRPETERVVEVALALLHERRAAGRAPRIADVGTGSGAILLALLSELPGAFGVGTDRSTDALAVARANARKCALAERSAFVRGDFAAALAGGFDLVVSNPPYVRRADIAALPAEIRDYEPRLALDGGADGLDAYRTLAGDMTRVLAPRGVAVLEIGLGQAEDVTRVFARAGFRRRGAPHTDLAGVPRVVVFEAGP